MQVDIELEYRFRHLLLSPWMLLCQDLRKATPLCIDFPCILRPSLDAFLCRISTKDPAEDPGKNVHREQLLPTRP